MKDWRLPENRREGFIRLYLFLLENKAHTEGTYYFLPAIAEHFGITEDDEALAWLAWLDGNTQNPVTTYLLFEVAPRPSLEALKPFVEENYSRLTWDTDRRHQKRSFLEATERILDGTSISEPWLRPQTAEEVWKYARSLPYMGRLSAWGLMEKVRLLLGSDRIPDLPSMMLEDVQGSHSYRNGLALVAGYDAAYWEKDGAHVLGLVEGLDDLAEDLLVEARERSAGHHDATRATLESALCMYKQMYKPGLRYPLAYIDRSYAYIRNAEQMWDRRLDVLREALAGAVPERFHPDTTGGWAPEKADVFRETGELLEVKE